MPLQIETTEAPLVISEHQVQAVARHAERQAELTAATLDATGLFPQKPACWPAGFLLELGAVLELGLWERQGLRPHLDCDLPTFREAASQLAARAKQGPGAFEGPDAAPLSRRVLHLWMEGFAWDAAEVLKADVIVGKVDEDQFAEVLADFVWQHRHELSNLVNKHQSTAKRET